MQQNSIPKSVKHVATFMIDDTLFVFLLNQLLEYLVNLRFVTNRKALRQRSLTI